MPACTNLSVSQVRCALVVPVVLCVCGCGLLCKVLFFLLPMFTVFAPHCKYLAFTAFGSFDTMSS